ncbi:MAG: RNA polymerase sigma factor (sigma-70 family) [Planctomycetota bacterium]|jgi:RNA polymerase sigma factor (sigma-70 family)
MKDRKLDQLFARFQTNADTAALARVFDATAPELLGIAVHLVSDVGEGEDLVQQTFLTAIEKAQRYDADRRLVPWLVGILVRHAYAARRKRARTEEFPERDPIGGHDPAGDAETSELSDSVLVAIKHLPANYRAVLEPYLLRGERAVDIAHASGKSAGTVRVQIRRGLDELRRALPAGLTIGTGVLLGGQGLADVRVEVLKRAAKVATPSAPLAATAVSGSTLFGTFVMSNKLLVCFVAIVFAALLGWSQWDGSTPTSPELALSSKGFEPSDSAELGINLPDAPSTSRSVAGTQPSSSSGVDQTKEGLNPTLARAHGVVIDEFGTPVVGVSVSLLEVSPEMIQSLISAPFASSLDHELEAKKWNPLIDRSATDGLGRFSLTGAQPMGRHTIGIDLGGRRPTMRIIDRVLPSAEDTDLGTYQLTPSRTVTGRVLTSSGEAVEGARVRAGNFPWEAHGLAELRTESWFIFGKLGSESFVCQIPKSLSGWIENLPVPTTATDKSGRFTLSGVSKGSVQLVVDHKSYGLLMTQSGPQDSELEDLNFRQPRTYTGRVVDSEGEAIAGAQVLFAGLHSLQGPSKTLYASSPRLALKIQIQADQNSRRKSSVPAGYGIAHSIVSTNAAGEYSFECSIPPMVSVRRNASEPWTTNPVYTEGCATVIPTLYSASISLRDRQGAPIAGARVRFAHRGQGGVLDAVFNAENSHNYAHESEEGSYTISNLPHGKWRVQACAEGFASHEAQVTFKEEGQSFELTLNRGASRTVRVLDSLNEIPLVNARVKLLANKDLGSCLAQSATDETGVATISEAPVEGDRDLVLQISHPSYPTYRQAYVPDNTGPLIVKLSNINAAEFHLRVGRNTPLEPLMVEIENNKTHGIDAAYPLLELSDDRGRASFEHLEAGNWSYRVTVRFLNGEFMASLVNPLDPRPPSPRANSRWSKASEPSLTWTWILPSSEPIRLALPQELKESSTSVEPRGSGQWSRFCQRTTGKLRNPIGIRWTTTEPSASTTLRPVITHYCFGTDPTATNSDSLLSKKCVSMTAALPAQISALRLLSLN